MSGVTPLVDTLLATRLAQRPDLVPLKGQFDIAGPGVVAQVEPVRNDVRLSSRAALQQQLSAVSSAGADHNGAAPPVKLAENVTLSAVARALTAILDPPSGMTARMLGTQALWPRMQTPDTQQLAATLADTVAHSGLFYESHLRQFAAGERTLAQVAQEPQAGLASPTESAPALASAVATQRPQVEPAADPTKPPDGLAAQGPAAAIHPAAVALVRQQLELLALPLFRWVGEAWPGSALEWDIQQEQGGGEGSAQAGAPQRGWTSRLALTLPRLGVLEARLSLAGNTLQLSLAAREPTTVGLLHQAGSELPLRLEALGLQLAGLQIGALPAVQQMET